MASLFRRVLMRDFRRLAKVAGFGLLAVSAGYWAWGGGAADRAAAATLTLYSGQHEQTVDLLIADFEKETGIKVRVHSGEGPEVANQLGEEAADSPADVYFTENSPELVL